MFTRKQQGSETPELSQNQNCVCLKAPPQGLQDTGDHLKDHIPRAKQLIAGTSYCCSFSILA